MMKSQSRRFQLLRHSEHQSLDFENLFVADCVDFHNGNVVTNEIINMRLCTFQGTALLSHQHEQNFKNPAMYLINM